MSSTVTLGFGGKKSELFNAAKRSLLELRPPGSINGNSVRGQLTVHGAVPMNDDPLIVNYVINDGYVDLFLKGHLPAVFIEDLQQTVEEWLPKGAFDPVEDGPLPSSIPIIPLATIKKTVGKKQRNESKELSVIDDGKVAFSRNSLIVAAIVGAVGLTMILVSKNMAPKHEEQEE